ncbi:putative ArsR family transcriptional regulator [Cryobacterium sp. MP_M5]|uniref:helix-turn-helix transcriptional regulator n=1 Tax=unclassified Cryobacterium TaxID=2649013 RepID=UPI0018CB8AB3|nr:MULTISPECIES: helix-turn-helix domain-containing protein [unclassified Cryobacterium]MBG6059884.1 putative ArsR family transcriptional regulator [Cryobacterium sp. MP_M3]MEC5178306.1 putative ArsR family transcriptional regulator [Cryobacterium sp. MP_M5]
MPTEAIDPRTHAVLSGISRVAVLEVVRAGTEPLDATAIAGQVGLHPNTVRSHLDRLVAVGLVQEAAEARVRPGRPRLLYSATAPVDDAPEDSYRLLAGILAGGLAGSAPSGVEAAVAAGRRWGSRLAPAAPLPLDAGASTRRIVEILGEVGFSPKVGEQRPAPEADVNAGSHVVIELHRCPFLDVARDHPDIVCSVHRGLMEGALERLHAPGVGVILEPFARPGVCLAHLTTPAAKS